MAALAEMDLADVRKALNTLREAWRQHSADRPFDPTADLFPNFSIERFCLLMEMNHHRKRHQKAARGRRASKASV